MCLSTHDQISNIHTLLTDRYRTITRPWSSVYPAAIKPAIVSQAGNAGQDESAPICRLSVPDASRVLRGRPLTGRKTAINEHGSLLPPPPHSPWLYTPPLPTPVIVPSFIHIYIYIYTYRYNLPSPPTPLLDYVTYSTLSHHQNYTHTHTHTHPSSLHNLFDYFTLKHYISHTDTHKHLRTCKHIQAQTRTHRYTSRYHHDMASFGTHSNTDLNWSMKCIIIMWQERQLLSQLFCAMLFW